MKINEISKLTGITVRALHYYDEIGLLKPGKTVGSGYRNYGDRDIEQIQQIMFFKELDFSLLEIKEIMENPEYDKGLALQNQRNLLEKKRDRLNRLIQLVDKAMEGTDTMSFKEFDMENIENTKNKYRDEVKQRWGKTPAYEESEKKAEEYGQAEWGNINSCGAEILKEFSALAGTPANSESAMNLVEKWQKYITDNFYTCTKEILSCLGQMYVSDQRFTENIDKNGEGTAKFMSEAIEIYCSKK